MAKTPQQRRSQKQEERAAEEVGGRAQAGSGASWRAKSDVRDLGKLRIECKYTDKTVYILRLADLKKIRDEAITGGLEGWAMQIEFALWGRAYAVLDFKMFRHMHGFSAVGDEPGDTLMIQDAEAPHDSYRLKVIELSQLAGRAAEQACTACLHLTFTGEEKTFAIIDWNTYLKLYGAYQP